MVRRLRKLKAGDHLTTGWCKELSDQLDIFNKFTGAGAATVHHSRTGIRIKVPKHGAVALFELTEAVQFPDATRTSGSADEPDVPWVENCDYVLYDVGDYIYETETLNAPTIYFPTCQRNDSGIGIGMAKVASGDRLYAVFNKQSGRWEALTPGLNDIWRFELKDDLAPGGQATAYLLDAPGGSPAVNTDVEFEVYDRLEKWRGRAKDKYSSPDNQGSRGYAKYMGDSGEWEILDLTPNALMIKGHLTSPVADTDSTFTIDDVIELNPTGGFVCDQDPSGNVTVTNLFNHLGDENGECIAVWDEVNNRWVCCQMECPA